MSAYDEIRGRTGIPGTRAVIGAAHVHVQYDAEEAKVLEDAPDQSGAYEQPPEELRSVDYKPRGSDRKQGDIIENGVRKVWVEGVGYLPRPDLPAAPLVVFGGDGTLVTPGYDPANGLWYGPGDPAAAARTDKINRLIEAALALNGKS